MNIQQAIRTGKPFKRPCWGAWCDPFANVASRVEKKPGKIAALRYASKEDLVAEDWQVKRDCERIFQDTIPSGATQYCCQAAMRLALALPCSPGCGCSLCVITREAAKKPPEHFYCRCTNGLNPPFAVIDEGVSAELRDSVRALEARTERNSRQWLAMARVADEARAAVAKLQSDFAAMRASFAEWEKTGRHVRQIRDRQHDTINGRLGTLERAVFGSDGT